MKKQKLWPVFMASAVFLLLGIILLSAIFVPKQKSNIATSKLWDGFYGEPKNSIDAVFIGPSTVYYGISPTEMYDEYGFTAYALGTPRQRMVISELYVRELFKTQHPKVVVVDQTLFLDENIDGYEGYYRTSIDHLKFSWDKIGTAKYLVSQDERQSLLSYIFPLFRYHGRWGDDLAFNDFRLRPANEYANKGYAPGPRQRYLGDPIYTNPTDEIDDAFDANALQRLQSIMDICEENGAEFLLMKMPVLTNYTYARLNAMAQFTEENGITFLDMNTEENWNAIGLDPSHDIHSPSHLNFCGATKVASFLGGYMSEHYNLPDHRGDPAFAAWDKAVTDVRVSTLQNVKKTIYYLSGPVGAVETDDGGTRVYWALPTFSEGVNLTYTDSSTGETSTLLKGSTDEEAVFYGLTPGGDFRLEYTLRGTDKTTSLTFHVWDPSTAKEETVEEIGE